VELDKEVKDNHDLKNNLHAVELKLDKFDRDNRSLHDTVDGLENHKKRLTDDNEKLRRVEKDYESRFNTLGENLNELRTAFQSLNNVNKSYTQKLLTLRPDNIFSDSFVGSIMTYDRFLSDFEKKPSELSRQAQEFVRVISNEIEILYEKSLNNNRIIEDALPRVKSLEQNVHILTVTNDENSSEVRRLNQQVYSLSEEVDSLSRDKHNLEGQFDKMSKELRKCQGEYKQVAEENKSLNDELGKIQRYCDDVVSDNLEKYNNIKSCNLQIEALEERIVIIVKEKECLENLLDKLAKSHPSPGINRLMNDLLNLNDHVLQLEREKLKVDNNIDHLDHGHKDQDITEILKEKDRLKRQSYDYDRKIGKIEYLSLAECKNGLQELESEILHGVGLKGSNGLNGLKQEGDSGFGKRRDMNFGIPRGVDADFGKDGERLRGTGLSEIRGDLNCIFFV
jgi:chromosome segregation ATPase